MAKEGIHPKYYATATFECTTCGTKFVTGSTKGTDIKVDTCSTCHPFYNGKQKFANSAGRVERFKSKFAKKEQLEAKRAEQVEQQKSKQTKAAKN